MPPGVHSSSSLMYRPSGFPSSTAIFIWSMIPERTLLLCSFFRILTYEDSFVVSPGSRFFRYRYSSLVKIVSNSGSEISLPLYSSSIFLQISRWNGLRNISCEIFGLVPPILSANNCLSISINYSFSGLVILALPYCFVA